jgi:hypothetical protein
MDEGGVEEKTTFCVLEYGSGLAGMGYFEEKTTFCVLEYGSGLAGMGYFAMPRGDRATIPAVNRRLHNIGSNKTKKGREKSGAATTTRSLLFLLSRFFAFLPLSLSFLFEILSLSSSLEYRCTDFFFLSFFFFLFFFFGGLFGSFPFSFFASRWWFCFRRCLIVVPALSYCILCPLSLFCVWILSSSSSSSFWLLLFFLFKFSRVRVEVLDCVKACGGPGKRKEGVAAAVAMVIMIIIAAELRM